MRRQIFASLNAQHQNLGDIAIRSQMVKWIAGAGEPHLLTHRSPQHYLDALALPPTTSCYDNAADWLSALARASQRGKSALVYSPGPQSLRGSVRPAASEAARIALTALLLAGGNPVVKLGRSYEDHARVGMSLVRTHDAALSGVFVRDAQSAVVSGNATIVPDLALGLRDIESSSQTELVVSLRGDRSRSIPSEAVRIQQVAARFLLTPVVVCQVEADFAASRHLADLLSAEMRVLVPAGREWRMHLSNAYSGAAVVVSDRLHASLFGVLFGALPVLPSTSVRKQRAALTALNIPTVSLRSIDAEFDPSSLTSTRNRILSAVEVARRELHSAEMQFRRIITERPHG